MMHGSMGACFVFHFLPSDAEIAFNTKIFFNAVMPEASA